MGLKGKKATAGISTELENFISTEHGHLNQILWNAGCGERIFGLYELLQAEMCFLESSMSKPTSLRPSCT